MAIVTKAVTFSEADLRRAAGEKSFSRGMDYLGAVADVDVGTDEVTATVHGTDVYGVALVLGDEGVTGACTCPHGQDGFFCKHLVAVGLTLLRHGADLPRLRAAARAQAHALDTWLDSLSREDLLALVRDQVSADRDLRRRLELRAAAAVADLATVEARVLDLLDVSGVSRYGHIEYADTAAYAGQVDEVIAVIEGLIDEGRAAEAARIAERALTVVTAAAGQADDSGGHIAGSALDIADAHVRACADAATDPVELATWLAGFVLGEGETLDGLAASTYHDVLGERGTAEYRRLITEAWRQNPSGWRERYLLESALRAAGDVDAIVALYAADTLPSGYTHLMIAQELDQAGRPGDALEWAERGQRQATATVDARLVDYLAVRYEEMGAFDRALAARQDAFDSGRTLGNYRALRDAARQAGQWHAVRERALAQLERDAAAHRQAGSPWWSEGPVWISALIDDGEVDAAWAAAHGVAGPRQWLTLADLVGSDRPADALPVYQRAVEPLRSQTGHDVYEQMAELLTKIRQCHERLGTTAEFAGYLALLRADQKRKRNLIKLLDQRGL